VEVKYGEEEVKVEEKETETKEQQMITIPSRRYQ
jgi:hypothetical protein